MKYVFLVMLLAATIGGKAATVTTAGSGNWNSTTANAPWPGGTVPQSTDDVIIRAGDAITVTANATINSVAFNNSSSTPATITVNASVLFTVSTGITLQNSATVATSATIAGSGTVNCASLAVGGTTTPTIASTITCTLTSTVSNLAVSGNMSVLSKRPSAAVINNASFALAYGSVRVGGSAILNADTTATATLTLATGAQSGTLTLAGATPFSTPGAGTATFSPNGTTATVQYSGGAQTVRAVSYRHLTLSGSGVKTLTSVTTVNGNLTLSGTASATTAAALTIGGNLTVNSGTTFTVAGFNLTVTGTTSVSGTLAHSSATGTKTFTGNVTINSGGLWNETAAAVISMAGNLQIDGTFTASTGLHTLSGAGKTLSGLNAIVIRSLTVSGTYQNNGTLTVNTALAGAGTLTQGTGAILNLGGTSAITGLTATANPNTVNYTGAAQTVKATAYNILNLQGSGAKTLTSVTTVNGNLTLSGTATATTAAALTIGGNLTVNSGTTFTVAGFNLTVTGTTSVSGTLAHSSATGTKTFTGNVTINSGGLWNETAAAVISMAGNLQIDGTFTASTGLHTLSGAGKTLSGLNAIVIRSLTVSGTYQNNGTLTVNTALAGAGTLTQGTGAILNLGGTSAITGLTATANPNTVNYTGAAQTVKATAYNILNLQGSGAKTLTSVTTVNGNLTLSGTATATTAAALTIGGNLTVNSGTTFTVAGFNLTVTGTTSVSGTLAHSSATGTKTFTGNVTINSGGLWNETLIISGSNTKTLLASIGIAGNLTVSAGTLDLVTFTADRTAAGGTLTLAAGSTLKIGGTRTLPANYSAHSINATSTVEYSGSDQTVAILNSAQSYGHLTLSGSGTKTLTGTTISGNLTLSGTATATTAAALTIGGNLTVNSGTTFTVAGFNLTVTGTTSVSGTLAHSSATGTKTFTGNVTINSGGLWNETAAAVISMAGNLQIDGTFTASTGLHTLSGAGKTLSGLNALAIPSVTVSGTYQNNGTLTVNTATSLAGAGTLTQGTGAILNLGGTSAITGLTATANPNTVNYTGAAQTVKAITYHHLTMSGSGAKSLSGTIAVGGDLTVSAVTLDLLAFTADRTSAGGTLTLNSGASLKIGGTGSFPANYTTHSIHSASTIEFSGTTQSIDVLNSAQNYGSLIISGSNTKTLLASIGIAGNLTVSAGTLDLVTFTADRTAAGGTLTLAAGSTLKIGGTRTLPANYSAHSINATSTVEYSGSDQTVAILNSAQSYGHLTLSGSGTKTLTGTTISGNLTLSGTATATTAAALTIGGNLTVNSGTTFTVAGFNLTVTGTTSVSGTLAHSSATGTKTFTGNVTINSGGLWNETAAAVISMAGNLQIDGTFTASTGLHTLSGAGKTLSGLNALAIPSVTVSGTYQNNGTLTVNTASLAGAGTLTQGTGAILNLGGTSAITGLTATANQHRQLHRRCPDCQSHRV